MCNKTKCDKSAFQKSRRKVLKGIAAGVGALALPASNASASIWEAFFQKHFRELDKTELQEVLARLESEYSKEFGKAVNVKATLPIEGVKYGYGLTFHVVLDAAVAFTPVSRRTTSLRIRKSTGSRSCNSTRKKGSTWITPSITTTRPKYPNKGNSTCQFSASNVKTRPAQRSALFRRPGRRMMASSWLITTGVSVVATAWQPAPTAPVTLTGPKASCQKMK